MSTRPGPFKHGSIYAYKARGCRCDACRITNREMCRAERRRRGVMPLGNPCGIGDRQFSSQLEAARSAKKSKSAINYHLNRHGNLDRLGVKPGGPNNGQSKPVRIGGQEWPSQSALDRALDVPLSPEANELLSKLYKTGKHLAKNRKAAAELMDAGLAEPGKNGGLQIRPAERFAAWQAQQPNKSIEKEK